MARDTQTQATCTVKRVSVSQKNGLTYIVLRNDVATVHPILGELHQEALVEVSSTSLTGGEVINLSDLANVNLNWR